MGPQTLVTTLRPLLPPSWGIELASEPAIRGADGILLLTAPDGAQARLAIEVKETLTGPGVEFLQRTLRGGGRVEGAILLTRFITPLMRRRLRGAGVSYADLTGNVRLTLDRPAILIETSGAERDPSPRRRGTRTLKGPQAGRIVRALIDWCPPFGVRELASRAGTDPGYATRVLQLLDREGVIVRNPRGAVTDVRWQDLLRRWTEDYSLLGSNRPFPYLAPRGTGPVLAALRGSTSPYALTGSDAVPRALRNTKGTAIACYVDDADAVARALDLRAVGQGSNLLLIEPAEGLAFVRTREIDGLRAVAFSQCAADLLTGPGRDPEQAEALLAWMGANEEAWRG